MTDAIIRLSVFIVIVLLMMAWELILPQRKRPVLRKSRWPINFFFSAFNASLLKLIPSFSCIGVAIIAQREQWGLLNQFSLPLWLNIVLALVFMDLIIYLQHRLSHCVPILWKLHKIHHSDSELDVSSGARFHPLEILFSVGVKCLSAVILGISPTGMLLHEIFLNAAAMFNHSNVHIPQKLDRLLRWIIVTPDMHCIHHSIDPHEHHLNFGFGLTWWDRLFNSYKAFPQEPVETIQFGLEPSPQDQPSLWELIRLKEKPLP